VTTRRSVERAHELVLEILEDLTVDLDVGPVTGERLLGSFGLESISLVYLIAEVQEALSLGDRFVAALRAAEVGVLEMSVGEFAGTAARELEGATP
jgi:hypothetical protein